MKKILLPFVTLFLLTIFAKAQDTPMTIAKASVAPEIDGVADTVWNNVEPQSIETYKSGENPSIGDPGTSYWKMLYTNDGFFVFLFVNDDVHFPAYMGADPSTNWNYDKPEIYFDVNETLEDNGAFWDAGHYQFAPTFTEGEEDGELFTGEDNSGNVQFQYAFKVVGEAYYGEFFIPFKDLVDNTGKAFDISRPFGFDITIIDADAEGEISYMVWKNTGSNMDDAGHLVLENAEVVIATAVNVSTESGETTVTTDNGTLQMLANFEPETTTNKALKWRVINGTGKASINQDGLLTAIQDGMITVEATTLDGYATKGRLDIEISGQTTTFEELNIVKNGSFDGELAPWFYFVNGEAVGQNPQITDGHLSCEVYGASERWEYQISQSGLQAQRNTEYEFSFVAWSDAERTLQCDFEDSPQNNWARLGSSNSEFASGGTSDWTINITTEPTRYTFDVTFDNIKETTTQILYFNMAMEAGNVYLDSISLVEPGIISSAPEIGKINTVSVYPNPAEDVIHFSKSIDNVSIININGQTIMAVEKQGLKSLNIQQLEPGVYFLKSADDNGTPLVSRFIKR